MECTRCQKPKANLNCGICQCNLCKNCAQFLEEGRFSFLAQVPEELSHGIYCDLCFSEKVSPALFEYDELMEKAKNILVYDKKQGKETRLIKRTEKPFKVVDCPDHDETILRLAFFAAKAGFNAIIDVDVTSEKVKHGSYQNMKWSGTAIPANVDESRIPKDRSIWQNPN